MAAAPGRMASRWLDGIVRGEKFKRSGEEKLGTANNHSIIEACFALNRRPLRR